MGDVLTYHVDAARTGHKSDMPFAPVGGTWRRCAEINIGAPVRAAPLFLSQFLFTAGPHTGETHDVIIIAAADNRVFAYSETLLLAGSGATQLWVQQGLGPASPRGGSNPANSPGASNIPSPVGICGTPVIDRTNGVVYVMAFVGPSGSEVFKLYALDLNTGTVVDQAQLVDAGRQTGRHSMRPSRISAAGSTSSTAGSTRSSQISSGATAATITAGSSPATRLISHSNCSSRQR